MKVYNLIIWGFRKIPEGSHTCWILEGVDPQSKIHNPESENFLDSVKSRIKEYLRNLVSNLVTFSILSFILILSFSIKTLFIPNIVSITAVFLSTFLGITLNKPTNILRFYAVPNLIIKSWSNVLLFTGYGEDLVGRVSESIELECPHSAGRQIVYFLTGNPL